MRGEFTKPPQKVEIEMPQAWKDDKNLSILAVACGKPIDKVERSNLMVTGANDGSIRLWEASRELVRLGS